MLSATTRPMIPLTMPVLGGAAEIDNPLLLVCGAEMGPGGRDGPRRRNYNAGGKYVVTRPSKCQVDSSIYGLFK